MVSITTSLTGCVKQSFFTLERALLQAHKRFDRVIQMPFYTTIIEEGTVSTETKAKIAEEITRIQTSAIKVPKNFVRVVSSRIRRGQGLPVKGRPLRRRSIVYCGAGIPSKKQGYVAAALDDVAGA